MTVRHFYASTQTLQQLPESDSWLLWSCGGLPSQCQLNVTICAGTFCLPITLIGNFRALSCRKNAASMTSAVEMGRHFREQLSSGAEIC